MLRNSTIITHTGGGIRHAIVIKFESNEYDLGLNFNYNNEASFILCNQIINLDTLAVSLQTIFSHLKESHHTFNPYFETFPSIDFLINNAYSCMTGNCVTLDAGALLPILPENYYYS